MSEISSIYFGNKAVQSIETKNGVLYGGGDPFEYEAVDGGYAVTGFKQELVRKRKWPKTITIPETYEDLPVVEIGINAFSTKQLRKVTIPASIKRLRAGCFSGCEATINLAKDCSFDFLGSYCFSGCYGITKLKVDGIIEGILSNFYDLVSVEGNYSFDRRYYVSLAGNSKLRSINLETANHFLGECFNGCVSLESITVGDSIASHNYASTFRTSCPHLKTIIIGDSATSIGDYAFRQCTSLTTVIVGDNVVNIGREAFYKCSSLTKIALGEKLQNIGENAFYNCSSLTELTIGRSVVSVKRYAFYDTSLQNIYYDSTIADWCNIELEVQSLIIGNNSNFYILDENGMVEHDDKKYSLLTELVIPNSVTSIKAHAFGWRDFTSVSFGSNVLSIGQAAFEGEIPKVYYDGSLADWCNINFEDFGSVLLNAYNDAELYFLDENGTVVHNNKRYSMLTEVIIPNNITSIKPYTFSNWGFLTSVIIPDHVVSIGANAFNMCKNLTDVEISNYITDIGDDAFFRCSQITSIALPSSVTSIGESAFESCYYTTFSFDNNLPNLTSLGKRAFDLCNGLTSFVIADGVNAIRSETFAFCSNLSSLVMGVGITSIEGYAFSESRSLTSIDYRGTIEQFNAITKNSNWLNRSPIATIHCTDGDITL